MKEANMLATRKAQELDVVELTEDLPEYDLKRGERGAVVAAFDEPSETYDLEFVDESGGSRFAYSVKPEQIATIESLAKEAFEQGTRLQQQGKEPAAERQFSRAILLDPGYLAALHNQMITSFGNSDDFARLIPALRFILRLDPTYRIARQNLALAFFRYGAEQEMAGNTVIAVEHFFLALGVGPTDEVELGIRLCLASIFTSEGIRAYEQGDHEQAYLSLLKACEVRPDVTTRHNLAVAFIHRAQASMEARDYQKAVALFERAEDLGLFSPELTNDYGVALAGAGKLDEAIRAFERALLLAPGNLTIQINRKRIEAVVEGRLGDDEFRTVDVEAEFLPLPRVQSSDYTYIGL
jgi:tetratricopeptide (TPR) repeat protein